MHCLVCVLFAMSFISLTVARSSGGLTPVGTRVPGKAQTLYGSLLPFSITHDGKDVVELADYKSMFATKRSARRVKSITRHGQRHVLKARGFGSV
jgi:hypothetical protein